jgi:hypothetical protein
MYGFKPQECKFCFHEYEKPRTITGREPLSATEMAFPYEKQKTRNFSGVWCAYMLPHKNSNVQKTDKIKLNFFLEPYTAF